MWQQLNRIFGHISPYGSTRKNIESDVHAAGVELAVRPAVKGTELQSISARANGHTSNDGTAGTSHTYVDDGYVGHPLKAASEPLPAQPDRPVIVTAAKDTLHAHGVTGQLSDQERSHDGSSNIKAVDQLLEQLLSQASWISQCPSGARLVLSLCFELAAASSPQQQHARGILQLLVTSSSWQVACAHCKDTLLLRCVKGSATHTPVHVGWLLLCSVGCWCMS
jgi:hypothetical protein